jgi:hypothetical protein
VTPRIARLRKESFEAVPSVSIERAVLVTRFYKKNYGKYSMPVLRALNFKNICEKKAIYIGEDELIVGERGPYPKAVSTFPELTCHTVEDLQILNSREMTTYMVSEQDIDKTSRAIKKKSFLTGRAAPCATGYSARSRQSGRQLMQPDCSPNSWSNAPPAIRPWMGLFIKKACWILKPK